MTFATDHNLNRPEEKLLFTQVSAGAAIELQENHLKRLSMFFKTAVLILCLSPYSLTLAKSAKDGAGSGGGGGAYRTEDGTLVTLPEFGVLIEDKVSPIETTGKKYDVYYKISESTKKELKAIEAKLSTMIQGASLHKDYKDKILSQPGTFIYKKDVDPAEYAKIKNEYRAVLKAFNYKLEEDKFVLPAVTIGDKTYIFPDFNQLSPKQQAKYLIHEAGMRNGASAILKFEGQLAALTRDVSMSGRRVSFSYSPEDRMKILEYVLKVDTVIEKIISAKEKKDIDVLATMKSLVKLKMLDLDGVVSNIVQLMSEELGREVKEGEIFAKKDVTENYREENYREESYTVTLDPSIIQETQLAHNLKRNYAEMLEGTVLTFRASYEAYNFQDCDGGSNFFEPSHYLEIRQCYSLVGRKYMKGFFAIVDEAGPFLKKFEE